MVKAHATANIRSADLLGDGSLQFFVTEPLDGQVVWFRGLDEDPVVLSGLGQPVRTQVVDIDGDGHRDLLVADIGILNPGHSRFLPPDAKLGRVLLL
jgi:hypothetical protein